MVKQGLKVFLVTLIVGVASLFTSCKKESTQPSWDVDILAPLLYSSLDINNLVSDTLLQSNVDSSLKIVYNGDLIDFKADTLTSLGDTTVHMSFVTPFQYNYSGGDWIINRAVDVDFELGDIQLKSAGIQTQFIKLYIENRIDSMVVFEYDIPSATLSGVPFAVKDSVVGGSPSNPTIYEKTFSLAGYTIDLRGQKKEKYNLITTHLLAYISNRVSYVTVHKADSLYFENSTYDIKPYYGKGYLGKTTISVGPEDSKFSLFNNIKSGILSLPNVNITLDLENAIGADAQIKISKLTSVNTKTSTSIDLVNSALINKTINIDRATETGLSASPVSPSKKTFYLNNGNSNIASLISNLPDKFSYAMQVNINPLGNISGSNDFIYTDYGIKAKMNVEIPLSAVATNLTLSDTVSMNLSSIKEHEKINSGNLYLYASNGLPFDAAIQLYLLNNVGTKIDSLLIPPNNTIASALLGSDQKVSQKVDTKLTIPITKIKLDRLVQTKKALVIARFNTANQPTPVSIYSNYKLSFKLIADINYTFSDAKK